MRKPGRGQHLSSLNAAPPAAHQPCSVGGWTASRAPMPTPTCPLLSAGQQDALREASHPIRSFLRNHPQLVGENANWEPRRTGPASLPDAPSVRWPPCRGCSHPPLPDAGPWRGGHAQQGHLCPSARWPLTLPLLPFNLSSRAMLHSVTTGVGAQGPAFPAHCGILGPDTQEAWQRSLKWNRRKPLLSCQSRILMAGGLE